MPSRPLTRCALITAITTAAALAVPTILAAPAVAASTELFVSIGGSDANPGTADKPLRLVQTAVGRATAGTTIRVMSGTYPEKIKIKTSGTEAEPITLTTAGTGPVFLTWDSKPASCDSHQPAADRTITIGQGADNWRITGLNIHNGIWIAGHKSNTAYRWLTNFVIAKDYAPRRLVPGHGLAYDPAAARNVIPYLRAVTGEPGLDSSDNIDITNNIMTGRGIYGALTSYGTIAGNKISKIPCGIGPGIWLMTFSNGWSIVGNDVSDIAVSAADHYMQEGIRIGSASDYNGVANNYVHDLPGDGRGINTDVDSSHNTIRDNVVRNVAMGYNDQMSGWDNRWEYNTVSNYRTYGYAFRVMDAPLTAPSFATSTYKATVRCNVAVAAIGNAKALGAGAMRGVTFINNDFPRIWLSKNIKSYWTAEGNTWNGSSALPPEYPSIVPC